MVECMTYRIAHHSTSDDSTRYRPLHEIRAAGEGGRHPIERMRRFLGARGWYGGARAAVACARRLHTPPLVASLRTCG